MVEANKKVFPIEASAFEDLGENTALLKQTRIKKYKGVKIASQDQLKNLPAYQQVFRGKLGNGVSPEVELRKHIIEEWTHTFLVSKLIVSTFITLLIGYLAIQSLLISSAESLSKDSIMAGKIFVSASFFLLVSLLEGIRGASRVSADIKFDHDGVGTPGQHMLQIYFYTALLFILLITPYSIYLLADPISIIGAEEADQSGTYAKAAAGISILNSLVILVSLRSTVMIVTIYEMAHSFIECFAVIMTALSVVGLYLILQFIKQGEFLFNPSLESNIMGVFVAFVALCFLQITTSILGFYAALVESKNLLRLHAGFSILIGACIALCTIALMVVSIDEVVNENCRDILQTLPYTWWDEVANCEKYGGADIGAKVEAYDENIGNYYAISGIGESAQCPTKEGTAVAWEYNQYQSNTSFQDIDLNSSIPVMQGCLQISCCASLLDGLKSIRGPFIIGLWILLFCVILGCSADIWLSNHLVPDQKIKKVSRLRAVLLGILMSGLVVVATFICFSRLGSINSLKNKNDIIESINQPAPTSNVKLLSAHSCSNGIKDGNESDVDCGGNSSIGGCLSKCLAGHFCTLNEDCETLKCDANTSKCLAYSSLELCSNGIRDDGESDVDCGGNVCVSVLPSGMGRCSVGKNCAQDSDCISGVCSGGYCASCSDGIQNGNESDVDCGSAQCTYELHYEKNSDEVDDDVKRNSSDSQGLCLDGKRCSYPSQCSSGICYGGVCASCSNGIADGDETDTDCGGNICFTRCPLEKECFTGSDCISGFCTGSCATGECSKGICFLPYSDPTDMIYLTCNDGNIGEDETDIDCGGIHCPLVGNLCENGRTCSKNSDCKSGLCDSNSDICVDCFNGVLDGDETDIDCGGQHCSKRCAFESSCVVDSDCTDGMFCWTEEQLDLVISHLAKTAVSVDTDEIYFPPVYTCQLRPSAETRPKEYPIQYKDPFSLVFEDVFETEDLESGFGLETNTTGNKSRRILTMEMSSLWPGFYYGNGASISAWPFPCTIFNSLSLSGDVNYKFSIEDAKGVKIYKTDDERDIIVERGFLDPQPIVRVIPNGCVKSGFITIDSSTRVDAACRYVRITSPSVLNLLVPVQTMLYGVAIWTDPSCDNEVENCEGNILPFARIRIWSENSEKCAAVSDSIDSNCDTENIDCSSITSREACYEARDCCKYLTKPNCTATNIHSAEVYTIADDSGQFIVSWPELDPIQGDNNVLYKISLNVAADGYYPESLQFVVQQGEAFDIGEISLIPRSEGVPPCGCIEYASSDAQTDAEYFCRYPGERICYELPTFGTCADIEPGLIRCDNTITFKPTQNPSARPTNNPTSTPSVTPTSSPSTTPSFSPTGSPSVTPSFSPTITPSATPTTTPTTTPSATPTATPSITPTSSPSVTPSRRPSSKPSKSPSKTPTSSPSATPSLTPSASPSTSPSISPSSSPSASPSLSPSSSPSASPSLSPSSSPSASPSISPSSSPSASPSSSPSESPSLSPSSSPSESPSASPSSSPSESPSASPTETPTSTPSKSPSITPSRSPVNTPTKSPTPNPSASPSTSPSLAPSASPSTSPSSSPSASPSASPSLSPSATPSASPSLSPSVSPSASPSLSPTRVGISGSICVAVDSRVTDEWCRSVDCHEFYISTGYCRYVESTNSPTVKCSDTYDYCAENPCCVETDDCNFLGDSQLLQCLPSSSNDATSIDVQTYDDIEEVSNGNLYVTSSDLELVYDSWNRNGHQTVGIRFQDVLIPPRSKVLSAFLQFECDESSSTSSPSLVIYGHASDSSEGPVGSFSISRREKTTASVPWSDLGKWDKGSTYYSPNLKDIVQEIVDRPGWNLKNALSLTITKDSEESIYSKAKRTAESSNGNRGGPHLLVSFTVEENTVVASSPPSYKLETVCVSTSFKYSDADCSSLGCPDEFCTTVVRQPGFDSKCTTGWKKVFEQSNCEVSLDMGETFISRHFGKSKLWRYDINARPYAYYYRVSQIPTSFSPYRQMLFQWSSVDNILNTDFYLYSTEYDLSHDQNRWQYCEYDTPNVGFPNNCGFENVEVNNWGSGYCKNTGSLGTNTFSFYVCPGIIDETPAPTSSPTSSPTVTSKSSVSGVVFDMETGLGMSARVYLFKGQIALKNWKDLSPEDTTSVTIEESPLPLRNSDPVSQACGYQAEDFTREVKQIKSSSFAFEDLDVGWYTVIVEYDPSIASSSSATSDVTWFPIVTTTAISREKYKRGDILEYLSMSSDFKIKLNFRLKDTVSSMASIFSIGGDTVGFERFGAWVGADSRLLKFKVYTTAGEEACDPDVPLDLDKSYSIEVEIFDGSFIIRYNDESVCSKTLTGNVLEHDGLLPLYTSDPRYEITDGDLETIQVYRRFVSVVDFYTRRKRFEITQNGLNKEIAIKVLSKVPAGQMKAVLTYKAVDDLDLSVQFSVEGLSGQSCLVGGKILSDGTCQCGGVAVTRDDVRLRRNWRTDVINFQNIHETVYNFFLSRTSVLPLATNGDKKWRTDGRCGKNYPVDGQAAQCPTIAIYWGDGKYEKRPCCGPDEFCGTNCDCRTCLDYRQFRSDKWLDSYRTDGLCRHPNHPSKTLETAHCPTKKVVWDSSNGDAEMKPCCSEYGRCGSTELHCNCKGCLDYRTLDENYQSKSDLEVWRKNVSTEQSGAKIRIYTSKGLIKEVDLPAFDSPVNYQDGHVYNSADGRTDSSTHVRMFCLDAISESPEVHEFSAPRYFAWQKELLTHDGLSCPGTGSCELLSVEGFSNNNLNGKYLRRYSSEKFPMIWYTKIGTLLLGVNSRIHLYRDNGDSSSHRWYFDSNFFNSDGYYSIGTNALAETKDPGKINQWLTHNTLVDRRLGTENMKNIKFTRETHNCDKSSVVPSLSDSLSGVKCSQNSIKDCIPFIIRVKDTTLCITRSVENQVILQECQIPVPEQQEWAYKDEKIQQKNIRDISIRTVFSKGDKLTIQLKNDPESLSRCANEWGTCTCTGEVYYGKRFSRNLWGYTLSFEQSMSYNHRVKSVRGKIKCTNSNFGDPMRMHLKACWCQKENADALKVSSSNNILTFTHGTQKFCFSNSQIQENSKPSLILLPGEGEDTTACAQVDLY